MPTVFGNILVARMHSSRMHTARSLTVSRCIPHTHPTTTHAPPQPHMPPCNNAYPPTTMHIPRQPRMPPTTMHTPCNHACPPVNRMTDGCNKNAFQQDAYQLLIDRMLQSSSRGVMCLVQGGLVWGVPGQGGCLVWGCLVWGGVCLVRGCVSGPGGWSGLGGGVWFGVCVSGPGGGGPARGGIPACTEADPPPRGQNS